MGQFRILSAIFLWSSLGIVVRFSGVPVHIFVFYSLVIAISIQSVIVLKKGYIKEIAGWKDLIYPAVLGVIGLVNNLSFFYAFKTTTISNAVLTHYIAPVIVAFLAAVFLKEKVTLRIAAAIVIASIGLWIMLDGVSIHEGDMAGIIAGLASGLAYALIIIIARSHAREYRPFMLTYLVNVTIVLLLAPFIRQFPVEALWSFIVTGTAHSIVAPVLYYKGLQEVTASRTAVLGYLEPVCAILLAMVFLKEMPGTHSVLGGLLILGSGYLTVRNGT